MWASVTCSGMSLMYNLLRIRDDRISLSLLPSAKGSTLILPTNHMLHIFESLDVRSRCNSQEAETTIGFAVVFVLDQYQAHHLAYRGEVCLQLLLSDVAWDRTDIQFVKHLDDLSYYYNLRGVTQKFSDSVANNKLSSRGLGFGVWGLGFGVWEI